MTEQIFIGDKPVGDAAGGKILGLNADNKARLFTTDTLVSSLQFTPQYLGSIPRTVATMLERIVLGNVTLGTARENTDNLKAALSAMAQEGLPVSLPATGDNFIELYPDEIELTEDNALIGDSMRYTKLKAIGAGSLLVVNTQLGQGVIQNLCLTGFDLYDQNSVGIRLSDSIDGGNATLRNYSPVVRNVRFETGWYDHILGEAELDTFLIENVQGFADVGRSRITLSLRAPNSFAPSGAPAIRRAHFGAPAYEAAPDLQLNKFGIHIVGVDSAVIENSIINNHHVDLCFDSANDGAGREIFSLSARGVHSEDFRPVIRLPAARLGTNAYAEQAFVIPASPNGFIYIASVAGVSGAPEPTWPTTVGNTVVDGGVTWKCVSKHAPRWVASEPIALGRLRRPTKAKATGWLYECTTAGTSDTTEPAWPSQDGATVSDGTVVWTARIRSIGVLQTGGAGGSRRINMQTGLLAGHIAAFAMDSGGTLDLSNMYMTDPGHGGDVAFAFDPKNSRSGVLIARNSHLIGNLRPWKTAESDSTVAQMLLEFTTTFGDDFAVVPALGDGIFSAFNSARSVPFGARLVTADTTVDIAKDEILFVNGTVTVTLPAPRRAHRGKDIRIVNVGTGVVTVARSSGNFVRYGLTTASLLIASTGEEVRLTTQDAEWVISSRDEDIAVARDFQSSTADGGTATAGAWFARTLNQIDHYTGLATLASNQITLRAGIYEVDGYVTGFEVGRHKSRLYDVTNAAVLLPGSTVSAPTGVQSASHLRGKIRLTATAVLELQQIVQTTKATDGLGKAMGASGNGEVYSMLSIRRITP